MSPELLQTLAKSIPDPISKQGSPHPYHEMITLFLLGLIAGMPYITHVRRWAKKHWHMLRAPLGFFKKLTLATLLSRSHS